MAIDQDIELRRAAFRGNPQGLQQRYQMTQELVDLLALQKLKSEQDAIARNMAAQIEQQGGTVADQLGQEMLARSKDEVVRQVGGIMQNRMQRQQQNMARMGQQMARPQMPAARPQMPGARPPMPGARPQMAMARPQTARPAPPMSGVAGLPTPTMRMNGGGIVAFASGGPPSITDKGPMAGISAVQMPGDPLQDSTYQEAKTAYETARTNLEGAYNAPKDERAAARTELDEYMRRQAKAEAERRRIEALRRLDAQQMDPEKLARQRRIAALLGASGKTRGYVGAGFAAGDAAALEQQEAAERNRLLQRQAMERGMETRDIDIAKEGAAAGRLAEEQAAGGIRALMTSAGTFAQTQANVASEKADREALIDRTNQEAQREAAEATAKAIQDAIENERGNTTLLQARFNQLTSQVDAMTTAFLADQEVQKLVLNLRAGKPVMLGGGEIKTEQELIRHFRDQAKAAVMGTTTAYDKLQSDLDAAINRSMAPAVTSRTAI